MPSVVLKLDMLQTLALAAVVLFIGYGIRRRVGLLDRYNTGAAFGKLMEDQCAFSAGVMLAMAAATFGLVSGGRCWTWPSRC